MPKYDYRCSFCSTTIELEHSMEETAEWEHCPVCQDSEYYPEQCGYLHKVFRPAAVQFRGSGWGKVYRTYKPKGD